MENRWSLKNGNVCFRFNEREVFERPWIILVVIALLSAGTGIEYLLRSSYYSLTPNILLLFFATLWWITIPMKRNEDYIERVVHEIMDGAVAKDAAAKNTAVVKSKVYYDTKGTYAIITGRCFLVLLNNGEVWEYPIEYHKSTDGEKGYYECVKDYTKSAKQEHIRAIKPRRRLDFALKNKLSDKARLWLVILTIVIIGGMSFVFSCWLVVKLKWWTLLLIVGYLVVYFFIEWLSNRVGGKLFKVFDQVISFPIVAIYGLVGIVQPFITIVGTYFFMVMFAFGVPALFLTFLSNLGWWEIKPETIVFIVLALGSIVCAHSYRATKWMVHQTPLRDWGNHRYESFREELALYLIHPSNVVFLLYLTYFIMLALSGYIQIENGSYLISESFDAAILKAFLVFIAFTNMRNKAKVAEIDVNQLLRKTMGLFVHDNN